MTLTTMLAGSTKFAASAPAFSPTDIAGLKYWVKADAGTNQSAGGAAATADGDPVGEWQDQSSNAQHLAQSTAANKPVLKTGANGINSKPVVRFDGTDDYLEKAAFAFTSDSFTAFIVCRRNGAHGGGYSHIFNLGFTNYTAAGSNFWQMYTTAADKHSMNFSSAGATVNDPTNMGTSAIMFTHKKLAAGASALYRNGTSVGTGNANMTITDNGYASIGSWNSNDFNGDVAEIIIYDTSLSDSDREDVEDYLRTKWGTP